MACRSSLYQIDPLSDPRWEELLQRHPSASVFHSTAWLRALQQAHGYRPLACTTSPPGAPLADGVLFCDVKSWITGRRLVSLPFSDHCEPLLDDDPGSRDRFACIWESCRMPGTKYLEIRPIVFQPPASSVLRQGGAYVLHRIDLRPDLQSLHSRFHKSSVQQVLRRARNNHLQVTEGSTPDLLPAFYDLLTITRKRHGIPPQPSHWFRALMAAFGSSLKIRIASKDGRPIAGILTLCFKNTMVYKYGGSNPDFKNLGGTTLLLWTAIQDAKARGLEVFDMGRSNLNHTTLIAFKEHWGAVPTPMQYWRVPGPESQDSLTRIAGWMEQVATVCPAVLLQTAGRLLYKHIG